MRTCLVSRSDAACHLKKVICECERITWETQRTDVTAFKGAWWFGDLWTGLQHAVQTAHIECIEEVAGAPDEPGSSCWGNLRHYRDSHASDLYPFCLLHLPQVPAAQHSHLGRMEPSLVNRALMERGKLWGWHIPLLCTRDSSRGASEGTTLPNSPARHQRLPGWPCTWAGK